MGLNDILDESRDLEIPPEILEVAHLLDWSDDGITPNNLERILKAVLHLDRKQRQTAQE